MTTTPCTHSTHDALAVRIHAGIERLGLAVILLTLVVRCKACGAEVCTTTTEHDAVVTTWDAGEATDGKNLR